MGYNPAQVELLLNLLWLALSLALVAVCLARPSQPRNRLRLVALVVLVVVLLPVISMTDDLAALQFISEPEHSARRDPGGQPAAADYALPTCLTRLPLSSRILGAIEEQPSRRTPKQILVPRSANRPPPCCAALGRA